MSDTYKIRWSHQFKKDYRRVMRQGKDIKKLDTIIDALANGEELPGANHDHPLSGNWANHRECHIAPDWLLIYQIHENILILELTRTGSHSDLF